MISESKDDEVCVKMCFIQPGVNSSFQCLYEWFCFTDSILSKDNQEKESGFSK
jgi:hypothetical protein